MRIFIKKKHKKTTPPPIKTKQHQIKYILHNIHHLHPILNYFLSVPEWHRFLLDKGVAILDLPMILLPNEIINKYMQNMKNKVSVCTYLLFYMIINKNQNYLTPILLHNDL